MYLRIYTQILHLCGVIYYITRCIIEIFLADNCITMELILVKHI